MNSENQLAIALNDCIDHLVKKQPSMYEVVSFFMCYRDVFDYDFVESTMDIDGIIIPLSREIVDTFLDLELLDHKQFEFNYTREATEEELEFLSMCKIKLQPIN